MTTLLSSCEDSLDYSIGEYFKDNTNLANSYESDTPFAFEYDGVVNEQDSYTWIQISGPGSIDFSSNSVLNPIISADTYGNYVIQLEIKSADGSTVTHNYGFTARRDLSLCSMDLMIRSFLGRGLEKDTRY